MSDLYLSEHLESLDGIDLDFSIERGEFAKPDVGSTDSKNGFKRYAFTESGVSPRSFPGRAGTVFQASSDEHDDAANIISDVFTDEEMRTRMFQKRMRKMERILPELAPPRLEGKKCCRPHAHWVGVNRWNDQRSHLYLGGRGIDP